MDWARGIRVNRNGHRRECSLMLVLVLVLLLHRVLAIADRNLVGCPLRIAAFNYLPQLSMASAIINNLVASSTAIGDSDQ